MLLFSEQLPQLPGQAAGALLGPGGAGAVLCLLPLFPQPPIPPPVLAAALVLGIGRNWLRGVRHRVRGEGDQGGHRQGEQDYDHSICD